MSLGFDSSQMKGGVIGSWLSGMRMGSMVIWILMGWAVLGMHAQGWIVVALIAHIK